MAALSSDVTMGWYEKQTVRFRTRRPTVNRSLASLSHSRKLHKTPSHSHVAQSVPGTAAGEDDTRHSSRVGDIVPLGLRHPGALLVDLIDEVPG